MACFDQYEILLIGLFFLGVCLDIFQSLTRVSVGEQIWPQSWNGDGVICVQVELFWQVLCTGCSLKSYFNT